MSGLFQNETMKQAKKHETIHTLANGQLAVKDFKRGQYD
jgi:hypothetical protein